MPPIHSHRSADHDAGDFDLDNARPRRRRSSARGDDRNKPDLLLGLPVAPRFVIAIVVAFAPVFLANLVFASRFRDVAASNLAFATNLLGAMLGGVLEYASLVTGYRALLIVIALLYAGAFMLQRFRSGAVATTA